MKNLAEALSFAIYFINVEMLWEWHKKYTECCMVEFLCCSIRGDATATHRIHE